MIVLVSCGVDNNIMTNDELFTIFTYFNSLTANIQYRITSRIINNLKFTKLKILYEINTACSVVSYLISLGLSFNAETRKTMSSLDYSFFFLFFFLRYLCIYSVFDNECKIPWRTFHS